MKVDLSKPFKDLDGTILPEGPICKILARVLANSTQGDPLKIFGWAMKLIDCKEIELDKSDFNYIKSFIKDSGSLSNLYKAQALEAMGEFSE